MTAEGGNGQQSLHQQPPNLYQSPDEGARPPPSLYNAEDIVPNGDDNQEEEEEDSVDDTLNQVPDVLAFKDISQLRMCFENGDGAVVERNCLNSQIDAVVEKSLFDQLEHKICLQQGRNGRTVSSGEVLLCLSQELQDQIAELKALLVERQK